jgi:serine/threonine-protein kinase
VSSGPAVAPASSARGSIAELPLVCPECLVRYPAEFRVCPRDAAELVSADGEGEERDELVGKTLANTYSITRVIGEGGMGRVYEARHQRIGGKRFAIKMLHPEYARMPEVLSRFQREAESAAKIHSTHVVEVYDVARTDDGRPFMVAEFLEGRELAAYLEEVHKLPVALAVRIVRQLCRGLGAAHELGIVHRDMKPENVFLVGDLARPTAKIIDFGISKSGDKGGTNLTKTGMIMGTPSYMAPEQARGERVNHLVDVYAVGAILYALVTGKRPFDKPDATATLTAVLIEEPARPRSVDPSIPDGVEAIIQKAMAKSPADRYATLEELERALEPWEAPTTGTGALGMLPPRAAAPSVVDLDISWARPALVTLGALSAAFVAFVLPTFVAAFVRVARGNDARANVTGGEALIILAFVVVAFAVPSYLLVSKLRATVWDNTARVFELVMRARWVVLAVYATYGLSNVFVRFLETVVLQRAVGASWPVWDLLFALVALGVGAAVAFSPQLSGRR